MILPKYKINFLDPLGASDNSDYANALFSEFIRSGLVYE